MGWMTDPKSGKPSVTVTLFTAAFLVACLKCLLSGVTIGSVNLGQFSGIDAAALIGSAGSIYGWRKNQDKNG